MRKICAWCGKDIGEIESEQGGVISHGMCDSCHDIFNLERSTFQNLEDYVEQLDAPTLVVDEKGVVLGGNRKARSALGKSAEEIAGVLSGDVMSCAYAKLPGGCGETMHCSGCTIRNSVNQTHRTGEPLEDVEAYQLLEVDGQAVRMLLRISTRKSGDVILLRIGEMRAA